MLFLFYYFVGELVRYFPERDGAIFGIYGAHVLTRSSTPEHYQTRRVVGEDDTLRLGAKGKEQKRNVH